MICNCILSKFCGFLYQTLRIVNGSLSGHLKIQTVFPEKAKQFFRGTNLQQCTFQLTGLLIAHFFLCRTFLIYQLFRLLCQRQHFRISQSISQTVPDHCFFCTAEIEGTGKVHLLKKRSRFPVVQSQCKTKPEQTVPAAFAAVRTSSAEPAFDDFRIKRYPSLLTAFPDISNLFFGIVCLSGKSMLQKRIRQALCKCFARISQQVLRCVSFFIVLHKAILRFQNVIQTLSGNLACTCVQFFFRHTITSCKVVFTKWIFSMVYYKGRKNCKSIQRRFFQ